MSKRLVLFLVSLALAKEFNQAESKAFLTYNEVIKYFIVNLPDIQYVTVQSLGTTQTALRALRQLKSHNVFYSSAAHSNESVDLAITIGSCMDSMSHIKDSANAEFYGKIRFNLILSTDPCDGIDSSYLRDWSRNKSLEIPIKLWLVYPSNNLIFRGFYGYGVAYWNQITEPRIVDLGILPSSETQIGWKILSDNHGVKMRTTTVGGILTLSWDSKVDNETGHPHIKRGLSKEVWDYIQAHSGLEESYLPPTNTWGSTVSMKSILPRLWIKTLKFFTTQELKGMMGQLVRHEADVAATILAQCCNREQIVEYTTPIELRRFWIYFKQPDLAIDIYFSQFDRELWLSIIVMVLQLQLVMALITYYNTKTRKHRKGRGEYKYKDMLSWSMCLIAQQGYEKEPRRGSQRIIFLTGFLFGMLIFCGFSANIISTLVASRSLDSFSELIAFGPINVAVSYIPYFQSAMRESKNKDVVKMMERYDKTYSNQPCVTNPQSCDQVIASEVANGSVASTMVGPDDYLFDKEKFDFMNDRPKSCALTYFHVPMGTQKMSYALARNLPYKGDIDLAIIRARETGLLKKMIHDYYPHPPDCSDVAESGYKAVSILFVYSAYYLLFGGYAMAIVILMGEQITAYCLLGDKPKK